MQSHVLQECDRGVLKLIANAWVRQFPHIKYRFDALHKPNECYTILTEYGFRTPLPISDLVTDETVARAIDENAMRTCMKPYMTYHGLPRGTPQLFAEAWQKSCVSIRVLAKDTLWMYLMTLTIFKEWRRQMWDIAEATLCTTSHSNICHLIKHTHCSCKSMDQNGG